MNDMGTIMLTPDKYRYSRPAPIIKHDTAGETHDSATKLGTAIDLYTRTGSDTEPESRVPPSKSSSPFRLRERMRGVDREKWRMEESGWVGRAYKSVEITDNIRLAEKVELSFAYMIHKVPVAQMSLKEDDGKIDVTWLTSHPGTSGGGQTMLEKAATVSQERGFGGALKVTPRDEASMGFYKSVGFKGTIGGMELNPAEDGRWRLQDGSWQIKGNAEKGYLTATGAGG